MFDSPNLQKSLAVTIKQGLSILVLLVVSGLVHIIPGAETAPVAGISIAILMRTGLAAVIVVLLVILYPHVNYLIGFYVRSIFWKKRGQTEFESAVAQITTNALLFVYVCVLYWTLVPSLGHLLATLIGHRWPNILLKMVGFLLAVMSLIRLYLATSPLLDEASTAMSDRLIAATEATLMLKCTKCDTQNEKGNKFCKNCGATLIATTLDSMPSTGFCKCVSCGAMSPTAATFCSSCGKPLFEPKPDQTTDLRL